MIGIVGAMKIEVDKLRRRLSSVSDEYIGGMRFSTGTLCGVPVVVAESGVGKVAAAACTQSMILRFPVKAVINTGIAGTLCEELGIGDVAIASTVVQHDIDTSTLGDPVGWLSCLNTTHLAATTDLAARIANEAAEQGLKHRIGAIASGDQFLGDEQRKKWIHETFDAIAGDMEAGAIGQVCRMNNVGFAAIRVISDGGSAAEYDVFSEQAAERSSQLVMGVLERLNKNALPELCGKADDFFGEVRWCEEDIENALEVCGVAPTEIAINAVWQFCESHHFTDRVIEMGWDAMCAYINDHCSEWEEADTDEN